MRQGSWRVTAVGVLLLSAACAEEREAGERARRAVTSVSQRVEQAMRLRARLAGSAELKPGDADGGGEATLDVDPRAGRLCYEVSVQGLDQPVGMHVHEGEASTDGPVVIPLEQPAGGDATAKACTDVDRALLGRIAGDPGGFYVNVHTEAHPQGAVRGQLSR